jgi:hypothetical protein
MFLEMLERETIHFILFNTISDCIEYLPPLLINAALQHMILEKVGGEWYNDREWRQKQGLKFTKKMIFFTPLRLMIGGPIYRLNHLVNGNFWNVKRVATQ